MKKRILALLLTLALVLPAVSCDVLLSNPNSSGNPSDSQSQNNTPSDSEKAPVSSKPETRPQTPPDSQPEDSQPANQPNDTEYVEPETEYIEPETEYIPKEYTVTFALVGYDEQFGIQIVTEGNYAGMPTVDIDPAIGTFDGVWYTNPSCDAMYQFDFNTPITEDITLYGYVTPNPAAPVLMITPEYLCDQALSPHRQTYNLDIASAELMNENKRSFVRLTADMNGIGDPWVTFILPGSQYTLPQYMAISYRTNSHMDGEFFMGSHTWWTGQGDSFFVEWNEGDWNLLIIDLGATELTSIENGLINFARLDFFTNCGKEGDYFDVSYIAFFNSPEYAQAYDFEQYRAPMWSDDRTVITHQSFDQFYLGNGHPDDAADNDLDFYHASYKPSWDRVAQLNDYSTEYLTYWGWIGYMGELGTFGYQINGGTPVYNPEWSFVGDDHKIIVWAAQGSGADNGHRMKITIPVYGLEGENTVRILYKSADGAEVCLNEITVIMPSEHTESPADPPDEPVDPVDPVDPVVESLTIPQEQWVISGDCDHIQYANKSPMVSAAGVNSAALLHQGSIYLGEIDLSKYDKVVVMWGCDNSPTTLDYYNANTNNRIMLLNTEAHRVMSPDEDTVLAGKTYTPHGWKVRSIEIDLTDVTYNGAVYLSVDFLPQTLILISSVEFIGGEIE